ncbi:MAG: hypothetical protein KJO07_23065, partial [Deltaproteobacteria bacterium]|nr:hypothetical protein [Deltaproteobacteria bacterium]
MKVWTRITLVTSVVVAIALVVYAATELGRSKSERRRLLEREAREVAETVRTTIEAEGGLLSRERAAALSRRLSRRGSRLNVTVLPATAANEKPPRFARAALDRLDAVIAVKPGEIRTPDESSVIFTVPIRLPDEKADEGFRVVGTVEVETFLGSLDSAWRSDIARILPIFAIILGLMIAAMVVFTRRLVTRPIDKLIAGMDDVAQGDL